MTTEETIHVGIDIGTTSAKICAKRGEKIILENKQIYENEEEENGVQNAKIILKTVMNLLNKTKNEIEGKNWKISDYWTCGQMHGIVFWNQEHLESIDSLVVSSLYNWTYSTPEISEYLRTLPKWNCGEVYSGFGMVTYSYIFKKDPESLKKFNRCGTIMDLFLSLLTQNSEVFMSDHNAHSWGYCTSNATWQTEILDFLPNWIKLPTIKREYSEEIGYWNEGKCHVASGDLQSSVASLDYFENTAYLIIGTSAQLCCFLNENQISSTTVIPSTVVQLPYSKNKKLLAACSMNGGNALESIQNMFFPNEKLEKLLEKLDEIVPNPPFKIEIDPIFIPERGLSKRLSIENVDFSSEILDVLEVTHRGIIQNLFFLFPISTLEQLKIKKLALIGSSQSPRFRRHVESVTNNRFELIVPTSSISTPFGATNFKNS